MCDSVLVNADLVSLIFEFINPKELIVNISSVNKLFCTLCSPSSLLWEKLLLHCKNDYLILDNRRKDLNTQQLVYRQYNLSENFDDEGFVKRRRVGNVLDDNIVTYKNRLLIFGGAFDSKCSDFAQIDLNTNENFHVFSIDVDQDSSQFQYGSKAKTMTLEGEQIFFGGWDDNAGIVKQILVIDSRNLDKHVCLNATNTFTSDNTQELCYQAATTLSSGNIIISGGCDTPYKNAMVTQDIYSCSRSSCYSDTYQYRNGTSYNFQFKLLGQLSKKRCGHSCISTFDDKVIIAGGYSGGNDYLSCVERLDFDDGHLRSVLLPSMSTPRSGFAMITTNPYSIYIGGGSSNGEMHLKTFERLDIREAKMEKLPPSRYAHGYTAGCVGPNERFYLSSGMWNSPKNHGFCPYIEFFDVRANKWETLSYADESDVIFCCRASHSLQYL